MNHTLASAFGVPRLKLKLVLGSGEFG